MLSSFVLLFIANALIELAIATFLIGWIRRATEAVCLLTCLAANLFTYPIAYLAWEYSLASFSIIEAMVFIIETMIYRWTARCRWRDAVILSGATNLVTLFIGLWVSG